MKNLIAILLFAGVHAATAQIDQLQNDPVLPGKGKFSAGLLTNYNNPPPALVADLTYGLSRRTTLSAVGGTTGVLALAGLRVNSVFLQKDNFRGIFKFNMIYYPERKGTFL